MSLGLIPMSDYHRLAALAYRKFGIRLPDKKRQLITNKFTNTLVRRGYETWGAYISDIENDSDGPLLLEFADRLTTNHTYFFREDGHFGLLRSEVLENRMPRNSNCDGNNLRIWCAGCATGEEAYSLAITLMEHRGGLHPFSLPPILATDISFSALKKAKEGLYDSERLKNIGRGLRSTYFRDHLPGTVKVKDELRSAVLFKRLNFMVERFPFQNRFAAIFCRNVMIYFDDESKALLIGKLVDQLEDGGLLFIGHSETIAKEHLNGLLSLGSAVYRKGTGR